MVAHRSSILIGCRTDGKDGASFLSPEPTKRAGAHIIIDSICVQIIELIAGSNADRSRACRLNLGFPSSDRDSSLRSEFQKQRTPYKIRACVLTTTASSTS